MPMSGFIKEHHHLIHVLNHGSRKVTKAKQPPKQKIEEAGGNGSGKSN